MIYISSIGAPCAFSMKPWAVTTLINLLILTLLKCQRYSDQDSPRLRQSWLIDLGLVLTLSCYSSSDELKDAWNPLYSSRCVDQDIPKLAVSLDIVIILRHSWDSDELEEVETPQIPRAEWTKTVQSWLLVWIASSSWVVIVIQLSYKILKPWDCDRWLGPRHTKFTAKAAGLFMSSCRESVIHIASELPGVVVAVKGF